MRKLLRQGQLLVICGPTATGKTALALHLAKALGGEILSADSRQVYRRLNVGTGKDIPVGSKWKSANGKPGYYEIEGVKLWGYDLADPRGEFSVGQYARAAQKIIRDILARKNLPIVVGGTGLYIKSITNPITTAAIPQNKPLRRNLKDKPATDLFETLAQLDSPRAASMNASDRKNPRRLIRAIEVAQFKLNNHTLTQTDGNRNFDILLIGLIAPLPTLFKQSAARINERLDLGFDREVRELIRMGVRPGSQAFQAIGYEQWTEHIKGRIGRIEATAAWEKAEKAYIKRQITWFKKDNRVKWFVVSEPGWQKKVERMVKKWHNKPKYAAQN